MEFVVCRRVSMNGSEGRERSFSIVAENALEVVDFRPGFLLEFPVDASP